MEITSQNGRGKIHPANCQLTAADMAAIAMIRNNAVWIHGSIKHCLRSWTDKFVNFHICLCSWNDRPRATQENITSTISDMICSTMQVEHALETWIQIVYQSHNQNFQNIVMDSCANFHELPLVALHAWSRKPRQSGIHSVKFSIWKPCRC